MEKWKTMLKKRIFERNASFGLSRYKCIASFGLSWYECIANMVYSVVRKNKDVIGGENKSFDHGKYQCN